MITPDYTKSYPELAFMVDATRFYLLVGIHPYLKCGDFFRIYRWGLLPTFLLNPRSKLLSLELITIPPANSQPPTGLVVTLHGWGANALDVEPLASHFNLPNYQFVLPNAPYPHPYSPMGRAWYDLRTENMYLGLADSRELLRDFLLSLEASYGVPLSRTILSGFSQGGAMTLDVGSKLPLAGLVVMSGYLHPDAIATNNQNFPPTLIMHGRRDEVVPLAAAIKARETVASLGVAVQYDEFDTGHEINLQMLDVARKFILNAIG